MLPGFPPSPARVGKLRSCKKPPSQWGTHRSTQKYPFFPSRLSGNNKRRSGFVQYKKRERLQFWLSPRYGELRLARREAFFWRSLPPALSGGKPVFENRVNGWLLVLEAKKIPHIFYPTMGYPHLYVPALYEKVALHEIRAMESERPEPLFIPPAREREHRAGIMCGVLCLLLLFWHGLRWHWFPLSLPESLFSAEPVAWVRRFGLDMYRTRVLHEWWRTVTALTLHADDAHLFSNLGFFLLFLLPLGRRTGFGLGAALTLLAGVFGNAWHALAREAYALSIGFSTSVFGAIGALCACVVVDIFRQQGERAYREGNRDGRMLFPFVRQLFPPLAAGLALLGLLGGGGEARTDYAAHIRGFCCGLAVTFAISPLERSLSALPTRRQDLLQTLLFVMSVLVFILAWLWAVR